MFYLDALCLRVRVVVLLDNNMAVRRCTATHARGSTLTIATVRPSKPEAVPGEPHGQDGDGEAEVGDGVQGLPRLH